MVSSRNYRLIETVLFFGNATHRGQDVRLWESVNSARNRRRIVSTTVRPVAISKLRVRLLLG